MAERQKKVTVWGVMFDLCGFGVHGAEAYGRASEQACVGGGSRMVHVRRG